MEIFFKKLIADISFLMMRLLDGFFDAFNIYTGVDDLPTKNGQEATDIVSFFINNPTIEKVFYWILIISVALLAMFTIAGVIKNMVTNKKSVMKVVSQFGGALLAFFLTMIVFGGVVLVGNTILREINGAFDQGANLTMSQRIIDIAVNNDNPETADYDERGWRKKNDGTYNSAKDFVLPTTADDFFGNYQPNFWTGWEEAPGYKIVVEEITEKETIVDEETGEETTVEKTIEVEKTVYTDNTYISGGMADLYKTNLFLLFFTPLILLILVFITLITLAKRLFEIVSLYLYMPLIVSTIPFDDGAKFKIWRETTFSKLFSVYGTVIALNLYILFLGIMGNGIDIGKTQWVTTLFNLLLILGGALAASGGATLFGQLIGASPDSGRNLGQSIYSGMMMASAGAGIARGVTGAIFGRRAGRGGGGGAGGRSGGILRGIGKALDMGGKLLGGNAYTGMKTKASNGINSLKDTLKGGFMRGNGLMGTMNKPFHDYAHRNDLKDLIGEKGGK